MKMIVVAMSMLFTAVGCSTVPGYAARSGGQAGAESRVSERTSERTCHPARFHVRGLEARSVISGPAVIEELATEGAGEVTLYLADDAGIADPICPSAAAEGASPIAVLGPRSRVADLVVPAGQRLCAERSDPTTTSLAWRGQAPVPATPDVEPEHGIRLAMLVR